MSGEEASMQGNERCEVCGKSEDRCFEVHLGGERHIFDSFECARNRLMPKCAFCGCLLLGLRLQVEDLLFCSYECAGESRAVEV